MGIYYIPYQGKKPAAVEINGHRLVIMSKDRDSLQNQLGLFGADKVRSFEGNFEDDDNFALVDRIIKNSHAGVVFAPEEAKITEIIKNLEEQLPWLH